ncbi:MAG: CoxG family protein [Burkholderiales bacterium]
MEMQASRLLQVSQQQAWDALNNPEVLKACVPGCDKLELVEENKYAVGMALKIGPVSAKFAGKIVLSDINPPHSYMLGFDGQGGVAGFGKGSAKVHLRPQPAGGCELNYSVQAQVGGKVAQLGQRLIDGAAKSMAEDFFKRFDTELQRMYPSSFAIDSIATGGNPVSAGDHNGFKIPLWAWLAGATVLAVVFWLLK